MLTDRITLICTSFWWLIQIIFVVAAIILIKKNGLAYGRKPPNWIMFRLSTSKNLWQKGKGSINSAVYETAKYQTKSKDYLDDDLEDDQKKQRVSDLEYALRGTRQFGFGGLLKTISAELKIDENDDDLIHVDEENEKTKSVVRCCTAIFDYSKFNYYWK